MLTRLQEASPIVVIGMHRSGTRVLVDVLNKLGVFMGADRQGDGESTTFLLINEGILHQCGAFWSEPMSAHFMLAQPEVVEQLAGSTRETLAGAIDKYGGPSRWHLEASSAPVPSFGWKDPRNTFTLPVWKQIFPNLRVIHIIRHGVDAAASLTRRHGKAMRAATGESVPSALTVIRDHTLGILSSRRGWTLPEAFTMWEQYVEKARQECAALGARALEIRYEDLLVQPDEVVPVIAKFCGVPVQGQQAALREGLERGRAFAFRGDPDLVDFAGYAHQALVRYGYAA